MGGYYSHFTKTLDGKSCPGFLFKAEPTEKEIEVFNDFLGNADETSSIDKQPSGETLKKQSESDTTETNNNKKQKDITYRYEHYGEKTTVVENPETDKNAVHSSKDIVDNSIGERKSRANDISVNTNKIPVKYTNVNEARKEFVQYAR